MYSAFSFGKIIKTLLPGSILAGTLFLIVDTVWLRTGHTSLLAAVVNTGVVGVAGAILVPASLILGFLLNTFVWVRLNATVRAQVDAELAGTPFVQLREALYEKIRLGVTDQIGPVRAMRCKDDWPTRLSLEYYFLPVVTVEHLSYLWESYFSWYEFHLNTLCALALASIVTIGALLLRSPLDWIWTAALCVAIGAACVVLCRTLWTSAIRNMATYERNLALLIAGSIGTGPAVADGSARREEPGASATQPAG